MLWLSELPTLRSVCKQTVGTTTLDNSTYILNEIASATIAQLGIQFPGLVSAVPAGKRCFVVLTTCASAAFWRPSGQVGHNGRHSQAANQDVPRCGSCSCCASAPAGLLDNCAPVCQVLSADLVSSVIRIRIHRIPLADVSRRKRQHTVQAGIFVTGRPPLCSGFHQRMPRIPRLQLCLGLVSASFFAPVSAPVPVSKSFPQNKSCRGPMFERVSSIFWELSAKPGIMTRLRYTA
jgi:hypothetical protein